MNSGKLVLLAIALVAVGTVVMPQTASLFAGQHWWYNNKWYRKPNSMPEMPCRCL